MQDIMRGENMYDLNIGDIVVRKSYGGDIPFRISDILNRQDNKPVYILRGMLYRIEADSSGDDLEKVRPANVYLNMQRDLANIKIHAYRKIVSNDIFILNRSRMRPGRILHVDSSRDLLAKCVRYYRESRLSVVTKVISEDKQPFIIRRLLEQYRPSILVLTGHDSMKKGADAKSIDSYRSSKHYIQAVKEARKYEASVDKLCIFAGACQSYYEAIMEAGANFASSPGRVLINGLDPALVSGKIALTDYRQIVTPGQIAEITISGGKGISGVNTKGRLFPV